MRSLLPALAALLGIAGLATVPASAAPQTWQIDPSHSSVLFRIKHLDIGYVYGRFDEFSGAVTVDDENLANAAVKVEIKATSVNTGVAKRDDHLRSPDFFAVAQFPTITFESTAVKAAGEKAYEVTGNLTLHGVTKAVSAKIVKTGEGKDPWGNQRIGYEGTLELRRADFGMDKMLEAAGNDVRLYLAFEATRK
jgi:polyisoprenoid-binding protein YceI